MTINYQDILEKRLSYLSDHDKVTDLQAPFHREWIKSNLSLLGLGSLDLDLCISILEKVSNIKLIWISLQECTGCSESLLRSENPSFDLLIFDVFRINYHELVMTPSGDLSHKTIYDTMENEEYILLVEGSIPSNDKESYMTVGSHSAYELANMLAQKAKGVFAVGTCSSFGGIQCASPNPTDAISLKLALNREVVNIPGCPPSDRNIICNILYFYLFNEIPELDNFNRPLWAYGKVVHDLCERKALFMSGDFVQSYDDPNLANGYCLYKVGCKGPYTFNNCPKVKFNAKTSWPVQSGHGCIGCSEPNFWDNFGILELPLRNENSYKTTNVNLLAQYNEDIKILNFNKDFTESNILEFYKDKLSQMEKPVFICINKNLPSNIFLIENNTISNIANISFESNPKVLLNTLSTKNKQNKKLFQNYKDSFNELFEELQKLPDEERVSNNLSDLFSALLHFSDVDIKDIDKFISLVNDCEFTHISDFAFKCSNNKGVIEIDISKFIQTYLAYNVGGLDVFSLSYSASYCVLKSLIQSCKNIGSDIILIGDIFIDQIKLIKRLEEELIIAGPISSPIDNYLNNLSS